MYKMDYGLKSVTQKILKIQLPENRSIQDVVPHLQKYFSSHELMESSWNAERSQKECVFLVTGRKKPGAEEKALAELQALTGDRSVHLYGYSQTPIL